jgi:predicted chitinase/uncharacterized protein YraI
MVPAVFFFSFLCAFGARGQDVRANILAWANWGVDHHAQFSYAQVRPIQLTTNLPWTGDCSGFVTLCYKQAGAPDPNGFGYNGQGYTGTLLEHGTIISKAEAIPGDIVVYGAGTGVHTAIIIEPGDDPMTISMGQQGDPKFVRISWDGRQPQRFVRFDTSFTGQGGPPDGAPQGPVQPAKCTTTVVNIRSAPGTSNDIVGTSKVGDAFLLSEEAQSVEGFDWFKVHRCSDGLEGFMVIKPEWQQDCTCPGSPDGDTTRTAVPDTQAPAPGTPAPTPISTPQPSSQPAKCTTTAVNVRSGPGTANGVVATSSIGDAFIVLGDAQSVDGFDWFKVHRCSDGLEGFMVIKPEWQQDCTCPSAPAPDATTDTQPPAPDTAAPTTGSPAPPGTPVPEPAKCTTTNVNIRSGAGVGNAIVATSRIGDAFALTGPGQDADGFSWVPVRRCTDGLEGFMVVKPEWQQDCVCGGPAPAAGDGVVEHWKSVIRTISPGAADWIVDGLAESMPQMVEKYELNTVLRQAHILAQMGEESASFATTTEFASGAEYEGRADLGNTVPGDGPRFKGRGLIQLTGRSNYGTYGGILGVDFVSNPEVAAQFPWAALTAGEYWRQRDINSCADNDDIQCATRRVNGGLNGLSTRQLFLTRAKNALRGAPVRAAVASSTNTFPLWAIGAIVGGVVVIAAVVLLVIALRRRRKSSTDTAIPLMQNRGQGQEYSSEFASLSSSGSNMISHAK